MAKINGTSILLYFKVNAQAEWVPMLAGRDHSIDYSVNNPDATTKGSGGAASRIAGLRDWTISVDGLVDPEENFTKDEIIAVIKSRVPFLVKSSSTVTGSTYFEGLGLFASYNEANPMEDVVSFSATIEAVTDLELKTVGS